MSLIEQFVDELELREAAENMFFSIYYVPPEYQPQESSYE